MDTDMSTEQFDKLWHYMSEKFDTIDARFQSMESHFDERFNKVYDHFDKIYGLLETDEIERVSQNTQLDRHEQRITQLEKKVA